MNRIARALPALIALALAASSASAHDQPYSYLDLRTSGAAVEGRVAAHVVDLAHGSGLDADSLRDASYLERQRPRVVRVFLERMYVRDEGRRMEMTPGAFEIVPDRKLVAMAFTARLEAPGDGIEVHGPLFDYEPQHETYLNVFEDGKLTVQDLLTHEHRVAGPAISVASVMRPFVLQGVHHIFLGPDHILFVVGLLLLGGSLGRLLKIITAFTAAHSLTLAAATLGLVQPSPRLVEPIIALSIVFIGVENLRHRPQARDRRALFAFCFGLVHGFGFASVLRDTGLPPGAIGWSLFSFNLGVELGQAAIVLAIAPLLAWVRAGASAAPGAWPQPARGSSCAPAAIGLRSDSSPAECDLQVARPEDSFL